MLSARMHFCLPVPLANSNGSLRELLGTAGPQAAAQVADLLTENNPGLGVLIANLLTTSEVTLTGRGSLNELLSALPAAVAVGSTADLERRHLRPGADLLRPVAMYQATAAPSS